MAAPLGLTMGEPAGIGGDIALKAWMERGAASVPPFVLLDDPDRITALASTLGLDVPVAIVDEAGLDRIADLFATSLPVLPVALPAPVTYGNPDPANGSAVIAAIDRAVHLATTGQLSGVVTNPIQKSALYACGFRWPGHTEYLAHLAGLPDDGTVMLLEGGGLRVVLATIHVAVKDVAQYLTSDVILHVARVTHAALKSDFGIEIPRLAVAALNPHAGEGGAMGREEIEVIAPAVATMKAEGINAAGPFPADTLFHAGARARYDAVVCMYHDQGLIPLKTLDFDTGVNITLGLPFVRTSPDHGTALSLAGTGEANASSLIAALHAASRIAARRQKSA
ncbi:4-hydroxythreonine-4-phosphate dehydrogenase PdxA [Niveispirillum cyanobacteriorum]|uniref:4-hydroxythreonine-4-phosphate dehydrogenase n=1 Tax=Niveispirillum cyanobacteriorum TaxID=1612173 RepID=A0A2K9NBI8_9PROT|nr:4-hydroxythreonine-4-phosphate dehydrogenase PdxA [Niveispirillum cyanobacteriorum]AUN29545.1 4-hydroxythreonine-4-phosphate dehydrogenase PdxA [Niveispirillum cyanobacteriorum]GGE63350.1 4-hydroxythreonine-4-phosphate dehydrogenase [Niveispirillum cyanobacteriorum]